MSLQTLSADDSTQLLARLRAFDLSVPGRASGRTTKHTEIWTFARLLASLANGERLAYPVSVTHRDRPDFLLQSADATIGVEVTEAISQQYAAYCALAEREFPDASLEPAHFRPGAPDMSAQQMRELLSNAQLCSDGWSGDQTELEWARSIRGVVDAKLTKLAHGEFEKFDLNWLAIYDNLPLPYVHLADAIALVLPLLQGCWSIDPCFDTLFVEHGPVIARITANGAEHLILNDLWE